MTELDILMGMMGGWGDVDRERLLAVANHIMASRCPNEIIQRHGSPYMERWWIVRASMGDLGNLYVHRFVRDDDEDLHDHPWCSTSFLLRGSYTERTPGSDHVRRVGDVVSRPADARHRIVSVEPGTVTLFATGPKVREWGFYPKVKGEPKFVPWRQYHEQKARAAA